MRRTPLIPVLISAVLVAEFPCIAFAADTGAIDGGAAAAYSSDPEVWDGDEDASGVAFSVAGGNVYTGREVKPAVSDVRLGDEALAVGVDYVVCYSNNVNAGVASVTVGPAGIRDFDPKTVNFSIGRLPLSHATVTLSGAGIAYDQDGSNPSVAYDGHEKTPDVSVEVNGVSLGEASDYSVSYSDNLAVGTATVTVSAAASGNCSGSKSVTFAIIDDGGDGRVQMTRLYNPWSGEHLYTASAAEVEACVSLGWMNEGVAWVAPASSSTPVYRLYNPYTGDHHYTTSEAEYDACAEAGWDQEGVAWYSADADSGVPVYRGYNPFAFVGTHHYTTSSGEMDAIVGEGWLDEGVAWYGIE